MDKKVQQGQDRLMLSCSILFFMRMLVGGTFFFFPIYLKGIGLSGWEIGLLMGINSITALLITLPIGLSNDLFSSKKLIAAAFFVMGIAYYIVGFSALFLSLIISFIMLGICTSLANLSMKSLIYKTAEEKQKGRRFSIMSFAESAGFAVGSFAGGLLLMSLEFSFVFKLTSALFILLISLVFLLPKTETEIFKPASYKREFFRRDVIYLSIVTFLFAIHWGSERTVYTLFLQEQLGFSQAGIGFIIGFTVMILAVGSLFFGHMLDTKRMSLRAVIIFATIASATGQIMLALSNSTLQAYIFRSIHELGDAGFAVFYYVMVSSLFSKSRIGGGSGFVEQVAAVSAFAGSVACGIIMQGYGNRMPMIVTGLMMFLAIYFAWSIGYHNLKSWSDAEETADENAERDIIDMN